MQLQYRAYSQVAAQLQMAEAKVQEETPAFTTLQPATVPIKKSGPKRSLFCIAFLFLAFIITTFYVWYKENDLISFLASLRCYPRSEVHSEDEFYVLSKYPYPEKSAEV